MPHCSRSLIAALGLIATGSAALAQEPAKPAEGPPVEQTEPESVPDPANGYKEANDQEPEPQPAPPPPAIDVGTEVRPPPADPEPAEGSAEADDELHDLQRRDLAAQESMAESTWQMAIAAWVALGLTAIGVFLIWRTLIHTRNAAKAAADTVEEAKKSTIAAIRAADAAAVAASSERAWITWDGYVSGRAEQIVLGDTSYPSGFIIVPRWKNTGRSPAVRVEVLTGQMIVEPNAPIPRFEPPPPEVERLGVFGPGQSGDATYLAVSGDTFEKVKRRELKWFIYSRVTYGTTIDPNRGCQTQFCALVEYNGARSEDGTVIENITLTPMGPQNTAS